jgi:hypothetical protein
LLNLLLVRSRLQIAVTHSNAAMVPLSLQPTSSTVSHRRVRRAAGKCRWQLQDTTGAGVPFNLNCHSCHPASSRAAVSGQQTYHKSVLLTTTLVAAQRTWVASSAQQCCTLLCRCALTRSFDSPSCCDTNAARSCFDICKGAVRAATSTRSTHVAA